MTVETALSPISKWRFLQIYLASWKATNDINFYNQIVITHEIRPEYKAWGVRLCHNSGMDRSRIYVSYSSG